MKSGANWKPTEALDRASIWLALVVVVSKIGANRVCVRWLLYDISTTLQNRIVSRDIYDTSEYFQSPFFVFFMAVNDKPTAKPQTTIAKNNHPITVTPLPDLVLSVRLFVSNPEINWQPSSLLPE
jgi:hypothetical protein